MAFSATINNQSYLGPVIRKLYGTWSGSYGDTAGTMTIAGTVTNAMFQKIDTTTGTSALTPHTVSTSAGISTVTVQNQDAVSSGVFEITVYGA